MGLFALGNLSDLAPLEELAPSLEDLRIKGCRSINSLEPIAKLRKLRKLTLENCGKVASLRPVAGLPMLEVLYFYGDTDVVDGDLEFLRRMPLKSVAFKNRPHYSLRREELSAFTP